MDAATSAQLSALILATGVLLDKALFHRRRIIFDRFTDWWYKLSNLQLRDFVVHAAKRLHKWDSEFFGERLFTLRSLYRGVFLIILFNLVGALYLNFPRPVTYKELSETTLFITILNFIPGFFSLYFTRWLLRFWDKAKSFWHVLFLFLINCVVFLIITACAAAALGAASAILVSYGFNHGIAVDEVAMWASSFGGLFQAYVDFILPAALFATSLHLLACGMFLLLHCAARACRFAESWLVGVVESPQLKPFTEMATTIAAIVTFGSLIVTYVFPSLGAFDVRKQFSVFCIARTERYLIVRILGPISKTSADYLNSAATAISAEPKLRSTKEGRQALVAFLRKKQEQLETGNAD